MKQNSKNFTLSFRFPYNRIFLKTLEHYSVSVKFTLKVTLSKFGAYKHQCKNTIKNSPQTLEV